MYENVSTSAGPRSSVNDVPDQSSYHANDQIYVNTPNAGSGTPGPDEARHRSGSDGSVYEDPLLARKSPEPEPPAAAAVKAEDAGQEEYDLPPLPPSAPQGVAKTRPPPPPDDDYEEQEQPTYIVPSLKNPSTTELKPPTPSVQKPPQPAAEKTKVRLKATVVTIVKGKGEKWGFGLGKNPAGFAIVTKVAEDGVAKKSAEMVPGARVVEFNGTSVLKLEMAQIVATMKSQRSITFTLLPPP
jgi:C-terminal processing protease CtpA/Prc